MTTTTTNTNSQQPAKPEQPAQIFAQWGLPHTVTPCFGVRLIQEHHRLHFLSDRASLIGEWSEVLIAKLEAKLLTGELDAQRQHCITIQHGGFTCEADTLGSHGYVYLAIYPVTSVD